MNMPSLSKDFYKQRREALLAKMLPNSIAVLPTTGEHERNGGILYPFRYDSSFKYLTGFTEPDAVLVLITPPNNSKQKSQTILFNRPADPKMELWHGRRLGQKMAPERLGIDGAFSIEQLEENLPKLLMDKEVVYYPLANSELSAQISKWLEQVARHSRKGVSVPMQLLSLSDLCAELRLVKTDAELACLRYVTQVSAEGHVKMMEACQVGVTEAQLESVFRYHCGMAHCSEMAYPPIVAGGENACILHYTENCAPLDDGQLVLIDAGAEYEGYAADITRTFPVNGRFSAEQRALYELVLSAQQAVFDMIKPGLPWPKMHEKAVEVITQGLLDLGLLKGTLQTCIDEKKYQVFYMHQTGHWLGLDVHDVGCYRRGQNWCQLDIGMVFTVEPGIYVAADCEDVEPKWRGIGIRIEDDVLVTKDGVEVLTAAVPRTVEEIEVICR